MATKRKLPEDFNDGNPASPPGPSGFGADIAPEDIDKILDSAPAIEALDETGLKRLVLSFERKVNQNTIMRLKFATEPKKFLESEVELDEEIKKMQVLAAAPELYPLFIQHGATGSLVKLLLHENPDIAADVVELFFELTDSDTVQENDFVLALIDDLVSKNCLELLVQNLQRLNEKVQEEKQAVHRILNIIENLVDLKPTLQQVLCEKTEILQFLLRKIAEKEFDDNQLYCSEILNVLAQNHTGNQVKIAQLGGIDTLMVAMVPYKKKQNTIPDEEEYVENLFDALCQLLMVPDNQRTFLKAEGMELMLLLLKSKNFMRRSALKVLDFALSNSPEACALFVKEGGLKYLFAAFMKQSKKGDDESDEEHAINCIMALFQSISLNAVEERKRLCQKFVENGFEKVERLVDLMAISAISLLKVEKEISEAPDMEPEEKLSARMDAGLYRLQALSLAAAHLITNPFSAQLAQAVVESLHRHRLPVNTLKNALTEHIENLGDAQGEEVRQKQQTNLRSLLAAMLHKAEELQPKA
jgi:beta-catenin-like protein 1